MPSPHTDDPKLTIPTWTPLRTAADPLSPLHESLPSSMIVQNILDVIVLKGQAELHWAVPKIGLDTRRRISGIDPFSIAPQPATSTFGPSGQTPQQAVAQDGGNGIGVTLGKPSSGKFGCWRRQKINFDFDFHKHLHWLQ